MAASETAAANRGQPEDELDALLAATDMVGANEIVGAGDEVGAGVGYELQYVSVHPLPHDASQHSS